MEFTGELIRVDIHNHWDEFGDYLDLPRIPDESMASYKARLMEVMTYRAGNQYQGLVHGTNRELGLDFHEHAVTVSLVNRGDGQPVDSDLEVGVASNGVVISSSKFNVVRESHEVPTDTLRIQLTETMDEMEPIVETTSNSIIPKDYYHVDWDRNELVFSHSYASTDVQVSYKYRVVVPTESQTLTQIGTALDAVQTPAGNLLVETSVVAAGDLVASGLSLLPRVPINTTHFSTSGEYYNELHLSWGEANIRALNDSDFIAVNLDSNGTYFNSPLNRWVEQARSVASVAWEDTQFDKNRMSDNMGMAVVPTLVDPRVSRWACSNPLHTGEYTVEEAASYSYICPAHSVRLYRRGFSYSDMYSGIGHGDDLKMIVENGDSAIDFSPSTYGTFHSLTGDLISTGEMADEGF